MSAPKPMARWGAALIAGLMSLVVVPPEAGAQSAGWGLSQVEGGRVADIRVEGAQRVDPETVRSYMTVRPGDPFDEERLDQSLKALFATGYFADVTFRREADLLVVRVTENPIINRIAFEGNKRITDEALRTEVQLRPRTVYTRTRVQNDVKRVLDLYRRGGRFAATVEPKIITLDQNRVDLVFEINEGPTTGIESIVFVGNKRFSDGDLRSVVRTTESAWWRVLTSDDVYDPDRLAFDRELLRKYYLKNGYADFRVVSAVAELTPDRTGFIVTYTVEEGERYRFGKVDLTSRLPDLPAEGLRPLVQMRTGDWYNADEVEATVERLTTQIGDSGYAFVDVRPRVARQRQERVIDVTFEVGEGPRTYVDRIEIEGNVRTLDRVIRREFRVAEGDAFSTAKLRRSRQRIRNLGFFEKVEVNNVPTERPDRTTIKVEVQEKATGELSLGAGYSSTQGALADIGLRERNLLGRGQDLRLGLQVSERQQQIDLSFTEPYFLDRNLLAGFDIFRIIRDNTDESSYDLESAGFALRMGYRITEQLSQRLRYSLRYDNVDPGSDASAFIRAERGGEVTSSVGQELVYDTRDNRFEPKEGYLLSLSNDVAGIGGDVAYLRTEVAGAYYFPLFDEVVLGLSGKAGYILGLGQDIGLRQRFQKGGDSFRGFAVNGLGPRAVEQAAFVDANGQLQPAQDNDALGGNRYAIGTVEFSFPLGLPDELGITGRAFSDFGTLGGIDIKRSDFPGFPFVGEADAFRLSAGVGLTWRSPFGPLRLDIAQAILKEDFDKTDLFLFSFGTRF